MEEQLFGAAQGWQCPICKRVYSPFAHECRYCNSREKQTTTLPSTGIPQEQKSDFRTI